MRGEHVCAEAVCLVGEDGIVVAGRDPDVWARAVAPVLAVPARLNRHRAAAGRAGALLPSWHEVLAEDLVPVWRRLAGRAERYEIAEPVGHAEAAD